MPISLKNKLNDTPFCGAALIVGSEIATALLLCGGLLVAGEPISDHLCWFGACFVAPILLLRFFAKNKDFNMAMKAAAITLFVTFILFMIILFKTKSLTL